MEGLDRRPVLDVRLFERICSRIRGVDVRVRQGRVAIGNPVLGRVIYTPPAGAALGRLLAVLPHAAVRVYVMGARALALEPATADDIARMREITAAAVRAGAFGVSTSRTTSHRSLNGEFIPTLRAYEDELQGLAPGVRDGGRGLLEVVMRAPVTERIQPNPAEEFAMLCRIAERSHRLVLYSLTQYHEQPDDYRAILGLNRQAAARGVPIRPVVAPRAIGVLLGLQAIRVLDPDLVPITTALGARLSLCGAIAEYNDVLGCEWTGPHLSRFIHARRATMRGFNQGEFADRHEEALALLATWVRSGALENAPAAFLGMLEGANFGKLLVQVSDDPTR